jgi:hypothetical protein
VRVVALEATVQTAPCPAGGDGVSGAPFGPPGLWNTYPCGPASRGAHWRFWATRAGPCTLCTGAYHLSKRTTQAVLEDLFRLPMSLGAITNLEQATVQALAEFVAAARE